MIYRDHIIQCTPLGEHWDFFRFPSGCKITALGKSLGPRGMYFPKHPSFRKCMDTIHLVSVGIHSMQRGGKIREESVVVGQAAALLSLCHHISITVHEKTKRPKEKRQKTKIKRQNSAALLAHHHHKSITAHKTLLQCSKREFNIVMLGKFCTLAVFSHVVNMKYTQLSTKAQRLNFYPKSA